MVITSVLRKVIRVIQSTKTTTQLLSAEKYIDLYYKMYGTKNKWVVENYYKKQSIKLK